MENVVENILRWFKFTLFRRFKFTLKPPNSITHGNQKIKVFSMKEQIVVNEAWGFRWADD